MGEDKKLSQLVHTSRRMPSTSSVLSSSSSNSSLKFPDLICRREWSRGTFYSSPPGTSCSLFLFSAECRVIPGTGCTPVLSRIVGFRLEPVFDLTSVETVLSRNLMKGLLVLSIELVNFKNLFKSIICKLLPVISSMTQRCVAHGSS